MTCPFLPFGPSPSHHGPLTNPRRFCPFGSVSRSSIRASVTTPSADFCRPVRKDHSPLSLDFETNGRSPEVSSTAFHTQPPNLQPVPLMDMGFAIICPLARHRRPLIQFLFIGSRVCSTLLSDLASRLGPCASLSLRLHQAVKRTCTSKLSNMLGTIGIGGSLAAPPLPHHRTCGSAYGGSVT